ncbi:MAG: hypothetical protein QNJ87_03405 [Gammaproteobacteria bacterium]|nr:hypothetical protein [Gammaproteobacteria bacterium]
MRNPAWRPARSHSARLADISYHLLGHSSSSTGSAEQPTMRLVPVLAAVTEDHPADALQVDDLVDALTRELNLSVYGSSRRYRWEAYPVQVTTELDLNETRFVVVFTTASLPGIRQAYTMLKPLLQRGAVVAGVLFSGAVDADHARRSSQRLMEASERFFNKALVDFGHVSAPGPAFGRTLAQMGEKIHDAWAS